MKLFYILFLILLTGCSVNTLGSKISEDLKAPKEDILGYKNIGKNKEGKDIVEYIYKTYIIEAELDEIVSKRTGNSKTFKLNRKNEKGQEMYKNVIYSGTPQFYKNLETDDWYQAERATTTEELFNEQTKISFWNKIFRKVYAVDATYYPDPHEEVTSVDGWVARILKNESWTTMVNGIGNSVNDTHQSYRDIYIEASGTTNQWARLYRGIFLFDASASNGNTIASAIFSVKGSTKTDNLSITPDINVYSSAPASNNSLATGDFISLGTTAYSTSITYGDWSNSYNIFIINSAGITFIQTAVDGDGIVKLGNRNANYDVADELDPGNHDPNWTDGLFSQMYAVFSDTTGTNDDPKLELTYSVSVVLPAATGINIIMID